MRIWYTYHLVDPRTTAVFYVGKGFGRRMYVHLSRALKWREKNFCGNCVNKHLYRRILQIVDSGFEIQYQILYETKDEISALDFEKAEIARIGIENLCNLTLGGEGECKTRETLEKMSNSLKLFWNSSRGIKLKQKLSDMKKGNKNPRWGKKEDETHKMHRMKNLLAKERWNKGLKGDSRCKGPPKGIPSHNSKKCFAIQKQTGVRIDALSISRLSKLTSIPILTLMRMLAIPNYRSRKWDQHWIVGLSDNEK